MKELSPLCAQAVRKPFRPERVIQFGEGNFLRAFVDWIIQRMNLATDFNGSVVVVQPRAGGHVARLQAQDCLYHVHLQGLHDGALVDTCERIDSISRTVNPYTNTDDFLALAEQPGMRFVISNTTEAGIAFDASCRLEDRPAKSFPGKLVQLLYHRWRYFEGATDKGLVLLPCELIHHNGVVLRRCIHQYIAHWGLEAAFLDWIDCCCPVCSTLVDRIVPGYPRKDETRLWERIGYEDHQMVQAEAFHLWVIEAPEALSREFPADRAGLNVCFVDSEEPYHQRKVTLLNGTHSVLAPVAFLAGLDTVRDACLDERVGKYVRQVLFDELLPTLSQPESESRAFAESILERFQNPFIDHQVTSIMLNALPKYAARDLPPLKRYLSLTGHLPSGLVQGLAAIIAYYRGGSRPDGTPIVPDDAEENLEMMRGLWLQDNVRKVVGGVLACKRLWGEDLNAIPGLAEALCGYLA